MGDDRPGLLWDGGLSLATLAALAAPVLTTPLVARDADSVVELAGVSGVVVWTGVVSASVLIYLHWRMTGGRANWLVLALTVLAVESLADAVFVAADPHRSESHPGWMLLIQILVAVGLFATVWLAPRRRLQVDPLVFGALLGLGVMVLRALVVSSTGSLPLGVDALNALKAVVLLIDVAIAIAVFRLTVGVRPVRVRLAVALLLLSVGHAASYPTPEGRLTGLVAIGTNVLGGALMLSLAITLVRLSWRDNSEAMDLLRSQLEEASAEVRAESARLHEIRATAAGIGTASRLLHRGSAVSGNRRRRLETMVDAEMDRLERLLNEDTHGTTTVVDLDATIEPIVAMHRTRGYPVYWQPSGHQAIARPDDVAEVVNVLLENAVQHAPHASASIATTCIGRIVEIAVSDDGPGIEQGVLAKIFEWGERGARSHGSGIGLNVARELTVNLGGYLTHVESSSAGTTFVLGLPTEEKP